MTWIPNSFQSGVESRVDGAVLIITINRPEVRNALDPSAANALTCLLDWAETQSAVRSSIITGAGDQAFSAGFDLKYAHVHPEILNDTSLFESLLRRPAGCKPLIAAVNGIAYGLGFELALACDLIISAPDAKFALPEPTVGLAALGGGIVRLSRHIGLKRAMGVILSAAPVSAAQGLSLGFVNEVANDHQVLDAARRWAALITACSPRAIQASKQIAYDNFDKPDLQTALDPNQYPAARALLQSDEPRIGREAFLSRSRPIWPGG